MTFSSNGKDNNGHVLFLKKKSLLEQKKTVKG